jgi:general secretion pathway protein L
MRALSDVLFADWSLARLYAQWRWGWRHFSTWWLSEFLGILPNFLAEQLCEHSEPAIRVFAEAVGVRLDIVFARGRVAHSEFIAWSDYSAAVLDRHLSKRGINRSDATVAVLLPPTAFFHRSFNIPTRARDRIHAIARQELERRTPFLAQDVYFGTAIDPQLRDSKTLTIRQTLVRRDLVEAAAQRLEMPLEAISFVAPATSENDNLASSVSLRPEVNRKISFTVRLAHALALATVVIASTDAALYWWRQETAIATVQQQTALVREKAMAVRDLEAEVTRVRSSLQALEERRALPSAADLWRETSRVLPDDSWVTDWRLRDGSLSLAGFSAMATGLVGLFEKSPLFKEASLDAPITFDNLHGRERFSLAIRTHTDTRLTQH